MPKFKVLFIYPNLMLQTGFPFAICILSSVLKNAGIDVNLFDSTFYRTQKLHLTKQVWETCSDSECEQNSQKGFVALPGCSSRCSIN